MAIQVSWANAEQTIIHTIYHGEWTLDDFHIGIDETYALTTSVQHTVHFISDFRESKSTPTKLLSAGRHVDNKKTANMGVSVMVGTNAFMKALVGLGRKLFLSDFNLHLVNTIEEAYAVIQAHDPNVRVSE